MNKIRMKTTILLIAIFMISAMASIAIPIAAAQPQEITIENIQAQTRYWPDGSLMHVVNPSQTSFELRLTGNVLHGEWSYSPDVTDLEGEEYVLVYNKESDIWILREGTVEYTSPYSGYHVIEFWEGYLKLDESFNIIEGEFRQDGYSDDPVNYPWAVWDSGKGLWHLGYSIYTHTASVT